MPPQAAPSADPQVSLDKTDGTSPTPGWGSPAPESPAPGQPHQPYGYAGYGPGYEQTPLGQDALVHGMPNYGPSAGYGPNPHSAAGQVASVGMRVGGWLLDFLFLAIVSTFISIPFAVATNNDPSYVGIWDLPSLLLGLACWFGYFVVPTALWGQTLAKLILGMKVISEENGSVPGWGKAFGRQGIMYLLNLVCYIPTLINALTMGNDVKNRGWHDRAAGTVVIRTR